MPNIAIPDEAPEWPRSLDDLRREPGRIVFTADLARLGIVRSYDGLKQFPAPLRLPGRQKGWEARTVLKQIAAPDALNSQEHAT